jgi:hypothetical protein
MSATAKVETATQRTGRRRSVWQLILLAPLIAEFVSGNLPITLLWLLVVYVPLYGAAALLIREAGRRSARPWSVIALLGLAYGVAEEAFLSGSLFNPTYAGLRLLDFGWIPELGVGSWWTVFVVVLHLVWSICVPIVLAESLAGDLADRPWLTRRGAAMAAAALASGAVSVTALSLAEEGLTASGAQLTAAGGVVIVLLLAAHQLGTRTGRPGGPTTASAAPRLSTLVAAGILAGVVLLAGAAQQGPVAVTLGAYALLFAGSFVLLRRWSRRRGWHGRQRLALATGALVPHAGFALLQPPLVDVFVWVAIAGDVVFTIALVAVLVAAWRAAHRSLP